ncbi:MAG: hypothetical protein GY835_07945 [bacterium]|nr:hypothetical protein [bacterium]
MSTKQTHRKDSRKRPLAEDFVRHDERKPRLPARLEFICAYDSVVQICDMLEVLYLRRIKGRDELWMAFGLDVINRDGFVESTHPAVISGLAEECKRVFSAQADGDKADAARRMLEIHVRGNHGFKWPNRFVKGGLIDKPAFQQMLVDLEAELKANAAKARTYENAPIVVAARELGLHPRPTGTGPIHWEATCPGTNHTIMIGAESNEFGCGYCRGKGGPDELREFVKQRWETKARIVAENGGGDNE